MIITNGKIITWEKNNQILEGKAIYIKDGKIAEIGSQPELIEKYPNDERCNAHSQYIMPGNICAHTHFYGALSRGMSIPGRPAADFPEILNKLWWPLDKALTYEAVKYSALVCMIDAIKHGTTTLIDHHASQNAISGSLDQIAEAVDMSGIRAALCYEVTDRDGSKKAMDGILENARFIDYVKREKPLNGRLSALFGLHANLTLGDETLTQCRATCPSDVGFHIHVAEHFSDEYNSVYKSGLRVVDRLQKFGILGPQTIAVHAVHVDAREIAILAETGTWVTHQPRSNMNNGVGVSDVDGMLRSGIKVCLGNDGFSNSMWEEWKAAYFVHKLKHLDPRKMPADEVAQIAVYNNAALASNVFPGTTLGVIEPGARADLVFVDYHPFTPLSVGNLPWQIIFGFHESMVTTTIVDGKILMKDRQLLTLDEEKITQETLKIAPSIWEKFQELS